MKWVKFALHSSLLVSLASVARAETKLPDKAAELLNKLPNKELSVEFVVAKAYLSSDSLRAVTAPMIGAEADHWQSLAPLEWRLFLAGSYSKNDNSNASVFEPKSQRRLSLGVSKYFSTGTNLKLEVFDSQSTLSQQNVFQPPNTASAQLTLSQNLLKDGFGVGTRDRLAAGSHMSEGHRLAVKKAVQDWIIELIRVYYNAWLSKSQVLASKTSVQRRERLRNVTALKLKRGTAEMPDVLQVESALLQSRAAYDQYQQSLTQIWRELVTNLKLPQDWMDFPAEEIPLGLDQPIEKASALCREKKTQESLAESPNVEQRMWEMRLRASEKLVSAAEDSLSPDLKLEGSIVGNSANGAMAERATDTLSAKEPQWTVGVQLSLPLEFYAEKAQLAREAAQLQQVQAMYDKANSDQLTKWLNSCSNLRTLKQSRDRWQESVEKLEKRAALEDRRFRYGRTTTMNVILAADDFSNAELKLRETQVALNQAAWGIIELEGEIEDYLKSAVNTFGSLSF